MKGTNRQDAPLVHHAPETPEVHPSHKDQCALLSSEDSVPTSSQTADTLNTGADLSAGAESATPSTVCHVAPWSQSHLFRLYIRCRAHLGPPITAFRHRLQTMTIRKLLWIILLVALVMVGNFMQIIMLNFWLISFPADGTPGHYTAFALPGIFFAVLFVLLLGAYVAVRRPSLRFAMHAHGWAILVGVGFCDAINSWMATYAASRTSEVLQALFTNLCPLYAVFLSKWILSDTRRYWNGYIVVVFVLTICGILAASLYGLIKDTDVGKGNWWILIFFLSMPVRVMMNVWQSLYMIIYTQDLAFVSWLRNEHVSQGDPVLDDGEQPGTVPECKGTCGVASEEAEASLGNDEVRTAIEVVGAHTAALPEESAVEIVAAVSASASTTTSIILPPCEEGPPCPGKVATAPSEPVHSTLAELSPAEDVLSIPAMEVEPSPHLFTTRYHQGEDTIVKLVMLAGETVMQMVFTLALLPADALPWWGNSKRVADTWNNFMEGVVSVFTIQENFLFCFLYTLGFVFTYVGSAYLNHYSAALCSIVTQLSSPVTALFLVVIPAWNVSVDGDSPWYCNAIAIVFLCIAALIYVMWEEMTDQEKVLAEYKMKKKQLNVRISSDAGAHAVIIAG